MNPINDDDLIKLNERLDTMLSSDKALEAAANSKSSLFRAAAELTKAEHPQTTAAMRERMRARVLQAVPTTESPAKKPILRPDFAQAAAKVAAVLLLFLFVGLLTIPATNGSLPGDFLYPAKRGLETVELLFAGDALAQVNVHLSQSERRIDESKQLLAKGRFDASLMDDALLSLENAINIANANNLFEAHTALEARSNTILSDFNATLETAKAADLLDDSEVARLESGEETLMTYLPSRMPEPSSTSEVTTVEASPTVVTVPTVATEPSPEATDLVYLEETLVYVNAEGIVNVREGAGTAYDVIARLSPNTALTAIGVAGDWTQVRLADGQVGWIANFLLSQTPPVVDEVLTPIGTTSTGTSSSTSSTSSAGSPPEECERGRSCEAPGRTNGGNGNNGNGNQGGSGN